MRSLAVAGIALVLVAFVLFLGTCGRSEVETPTTTTTTSTTSSTTSTTTTTTTTTVDPASLGTLPPVEGIGAPTLDRSSSVTTVGIDTVYFGMTLAEAQVAAGSRFSPASPMGGECFLATPDDAPEGITFWIVSGTVERVDIDTDEVTTRSGAGIGDTEERITSMFPERIQSSPLPDGSGNLLAFVPRDEADKAYRVMFQTDGERVVRLWSGRVPWVERIDRNCYDR